MPGKFVKVKCRKCNNEQNVFNKPAEAVRCLVCGEILAKNTGGECDFSSDVLQVL